MAPVITITTDFGLRDGYVAGLKGVILGIAPEARLVDVTHLVPPGDIRAGAFILASIYRDFPPGTVHLAVIDPGVGTERRALAIRTPQYSFVGPDNGLFSRVLSAEPDRDVRSLENSKYWRPVVSSTFHGRDIFAPVAAHISLGVPFDELGPQCSPVNPEWNEPRVGPDGIEGEVVHVDHFGNAITNITRERLEAFALRNQWLVCVGDQTIPAVRATYGQEKPGALMSLIGSSGLLEIAVNQGNAAALLGIGPGVPVTVRRSSTPV